jgi:tripartite-type tricarboxylate transporter receptor subunit TctC
MRALTVGLRRSLRRSLACGLGFASIAGMSVAQEYPTRPVRFIVHTVAGGFDVYARLLSPKLAASLGQPFVVENRPGANGNIAMEQVARSVPDGHTILLGATGALSVNPSVFEKMPIDLDTDLIPVALIGTVPMIWVSHPKSGIATIDDLVRQARERPGKIDFANAAIGSLNHLIFEAFRFRNKVDIVSVTYKATAPAQTDLIAGVVPVMIDSLAVAMPQIKAGRITPLAVTTRQRAITLPDTPTVIERSLEDDEYLGWYGVVAPKGVPAAVVERLNRAINHALNEPDVRERFAALGAVPVSESVEHFGRFLTAERAKWRRIVREARVKVEQ